MRVVTQQELARAANRASLFDTPTAAVCERGREGGREERLCECVREGGREERLSECVREGEREGDHNIPAVLSANSKYSKSSTSLCGTHT